MLLVVAHREVVDEECTTHMSMLYTLARLLQFAGLLVLPVAMAGNIAESLDLRQMLVLAGIGIGLFTAGWLLQQVTRPK